MYPSFFLYSPPRIGGGGLARGSIRVLSQLNPNTNDIIIAVYFIILLHTIVPVSAPSYKGHTHIHTRPATLAACLLAGADKR